MYNEHIVSFFIKWLVKRNILLKTKAISEHNCPFTFIMTSSIAKDIVEYQKYFPNNFYSQRLQSQLICNIKGMCPWDKPIRFFLLLIYFFLPCIWMSIIDKREWWITYLYSFFSYIYMLTSLWSLGFDTHAHEFLRLLQYWISSIFLCFSGLTQNWCIRIKYYNTYFISRLTLRHDLRWINSCRKNHNCINHSSRKKGLLPTTQ